MIEFFKILKEQFRYRNQIQKLAFYNMKSIYANHYLGLFWNVIQPVLQFSIYYIVFGLGLRSGGDRVLEGIPFILYLLSGIFPWLYISQGINTGASSILKNLSLLSKMNFPPSVFISITLSNNVFNLLITSVIMIIVSVAFDLVPYWHFLYFMYFLFSSMILIFGISLITSILIVKVRDVRNILQNIIRSLFFLTPIFWSFEEANGILKVITSLNPFSYLINIYRISFVQENANKIGTMIDHLYFWVFTLIILSIGGILYNRYHRKLVDFT